MLKMKELAMENEGTAYALVGQAIRDEAKIGQTLSGYLITQSYRLDELWLASES